MNFRLLFRLFFLSILYIAVQGSQVNSMAPKNSEKMFQLPTSNENEIFIVENPSGTAQWEAFQFPKKTEPAWIQKSDSQLPTHLFKRGPRTGLFVPLGYVGKESSLGEEIVRNFVMPSQPSGVKLWDALQSSGK